MRARGAAQSSSAVGTMRVINSAQLSYAITCGFGFYSPDFQTLAKLPPGAVEAFLPPELGTGPTFVKSGYTFSMAGTAVAGAPATCNGLSAGTAVPGYAAVADQMDIAAPQGRFFGTNADGVIYEHNDSLAAIMPESGPPSSGSPSSPPPVSFVWPVFFFTFHFVCLRWGGGDTVVFGFVVWWGGGSGAPSCRGAKRDAAQTAVWFQYRRRYHSPPPSQIAAGRSSTRSRIG